MENWKKIEGFITYEISDKGEVRSLNYKNTNKTIILKQSNHKDGYKIVSIGNINNRKTFKVHRLVAIAFINNPNNKLEVNHINGIKNDNRLINLEWCTHSENIIHSYNTGLQKGLKRTNNPNSKLSEKEIKEIANSNLKQIELAKKYNISQSNVSYIKIREENLKLNYGI